MNAPCLLPMRSLNLANCSQLVRLRGWVGWLTFDSFRSELTLRKPFGCAVVRLEELADACEVEEEDVSDFYEQSQAIRAELNDWYDRREFTGD